ncbi:Acetyltransferase [Amycolatopsis camponoti]|uniref:Acetyltransferase n=1 Tax=Amycolatopsis camponoti TaxID=2606593 RepID=A0A6I8LLW2_9PSEU|nr:GNAT family N-acetyltransferase [Amycolatopsis camponoti]VVJ17972.1 Acetyltransferase [Amycolatopsis camponoti]
MGDLPARTERLVVRRFAAGDVAAFTAYRSDPEVARYQGWDAPVPEAAARRLVHEFATAVEGKPGWFQYAVERDGVLIGDVGIRLAGNRKQAEVGFTIARAHQGNGYASEAVQCVLDRVFATGVRRVSAECDARNTASARLLERLGFTREGVRRRHTWLKGEWTDDLLFGLLAENRHAAGPAIFACRPNLLVSDLGTSLDFYSGLLGFRIGWRWSDPRARFLSEGEPHEPGTAMVERDGVQIMLTQAAGAHTTRLHLDVHTAGQVDALFREWRGRGADIAEPPFVRPWGMYEMRLLDPDGTVLRVSSPPAP